MATPKPALDKTGWIDIGITIGWTVILGTAMAFLFYHRQLPALHMRRLSLVFTAVILLHLYWTVTMIAYVIGPVAPCAVEYWLMSIYLPFGVAIFQVANTQFLHIATQQKRFTSIQSLDNFLQTAKHSVLNGQTGYSFKRIVRRLKNVDRLSRMVIFIGMGMSVQAILTLVIFVLSRKFHPGFGLLPADLSGTDAIVRQRCSRGWEWWLSIGWQFFWAWIYAPYVLWKSRNIKDTHGWRVQTILCCIAGLPASPLWLCGLYVPEFASLNAFFIPPQWFSVSIFFIEVFAIFIPCYQVFKQHNLRQETLQAIAAWEIKNSNLDLGSIDSESTKTQGLTELSFKTTDASEKGLVRVESIGNCTSSSSISSRKSHMYTMVALEHALKWNAGPLQKFAALKDFSGENVSFLTHLATWKRTWTQLEQEKHNFRLPSEQSSDKAEELRGQFNRALRLYAAFVSGRHAEFPINISSRTLRALDDMFADAADTLLGDEARQDLGNAATPFEMPDTTSRRSEYSAEAERGAGIRQGSAGSDATFAPNSVWYWGPIPGNFTADVFNDAEHEIKYLVLTNTWPKFVNAGHAEQIREGGGMSLNRRLSQYFFWRESRL